MEIILIKFISFVIAIWFTSVNIIKGVRGQRIPATNFMIMSISIATFVFLQFNLWE
jgi:hypothetical protein